MKRISNGTRVAVISGDLEHSISYGVVLGSKSQTYFVRLDDETEADFADWQVLTLATAQRITKSLGGVEDFRIEATDKSMGNITYVTRKSGRVGCVDKQGFPMSLHYAGITNGQYFEAEVATARTADEALQVFARHSYYDGALV